MTTPQPTEEQINFAAEVLKYIRREYADVRKGHEEPGIFTPRIDAIDTVLAALAASRRDSVLLDYFDKLRVADVRRSGDPRDEPELLGYIWTIDGRFTDIRSALEDHFEDNERLRAAIDAAAKGATE